VLYAPGYWRIETNQEINDTLKEQNITGFIKNKENNIVQRIKRWKPMPKRPIGRPKTHWEVDVLEDIKNMNVGNWKKVAQNRDSWKKVAQNRDSWKKVAQNRDSWKKVAQNRDS